MTVPPSAEHHEMVLVQFGFSLRALRPPPSLRFCIADSKTLKKLMKHDAPYLIC